MKNVETLYQELLTRPSDIRAHLPALRELASQSQRVVELGVRDGNSTTALLAGQPDSLLMVDIVPRPEVFGRLQAVSGRTALNYAWEDSRTFGMVPSDLLFIDTLHTYEQLKAELAQHAGRVRRWIALHDTETFRERGEDGSAGLWPAIEELLESATGWQIESHDPRDHGFTVLRIR